MANERPQTLLGRTYRIGTPFGTVFLTLNETESGCPFELFLKIGKCGSDIAADAEAIGRLCTLLLRLPSTVPEQQRIENIVRHLTGIGGSKSVVSGDHQIRSVPDAVAFALSSYLSEKTIENSL